MRVKLLLTWLAVMLLSCISGCPSTRVEYVPAPACPCRCRTLPPSPAQEVTPPGLLGQPSAQTACEEGCRGRCVDDRTPPSAGSARELSWTPGHAAGQEPQDGAGPAGEQPSGDAAPH